MMNYMFLYDCRYSGIRRRGRRPRSTGGASRCPGGLPSLLIAGSIIAHASKKTQRTRKPAHLPVRSLPGKSGHPKVPWWLGCQGPSAPREWRRWADKVRKVESIMWCACCRSSFWWGDCIWISASYHKTITWLGSCPKSSHRMIVASLPSKQKQTKKQHHEQKQPIKTWKQLVFTWGLGPAQNVSLRQSEGGMLRLETLIEPKFLNLSFSSIFS